MCVGVCVCVCMCLSHAVPHEHVQVVLDELSYRRMHLDDMPFIAYACFTVLCLCLSLCSPIPSRPIRLPSDSVRERRESAHSRMRACKRESMRSRKTLSLHALKVQNVCTRLCVCVVCTETIFVDRELEPEPEASSL